MTYTLIFEMSDDEFAAEVASTTDRLITEIERLRTVMPLETPEMAWKRKVNPGKFNDDYFLADYGYTLNRMTDMILSSRHNLDFLRVFDKHLLRQPDVDRADAVTRTASVLSHSLGGDIADTMTSDHIERLLAYERAFSATDNVFPNPTQRPILHFVNALKYAAVVGDENASAYIIENLHAIGALMVERKIAQYGDVLELVTAMNNSSPALLNGAL
jgi:hypothetical protein